MERLKKLPTRGLCCWFLEGPGSPTRRLIADGFGLQEIPSFGGSKSSGCFLSQADHVLQGPPAKAPEAETKVMRPWPLATLAHWSNGSSMSVCHGRGPCKWLLGAVVQKLRMDVSDLECFFVVRFFSGLDSAFNLFFSGLDR